MEADPEVEIQIDSLLGQLEAGLSRAAVEEFDALVRETRRQCEELIETLKNDIERILSGYSSRAHIRKAFEVVRTRDDQGRYTVNLVFKIAKLPRPYF